MYFNESAHRITAIQRTLWAAQHINALYVGVIKVECRLIYIRYIVNIQPHGRSVDARTDAADINSGRQT